MILVTGASGSVGTALVNELLAQGAGPVRVVSRSKATATAVRAGVESVVADFADPASLPPALAGVSAAFLVCAAVPELVELETNFLRAARDAGTPHVVIQSARGAGSFDKSFPSWHAQVERAAADLGVPHAVLRPNGFMQNIAAYNGQTIRTQDCFYTALGGARVSHIDVRDIATAAAKALLAPAQTAGRVFELSGPERLTDAELADRISAVAGRTVRAVEVSLDQLRQGMVAAGMPAAQAGWVVDLYAYYRAGGADGEPGELEALTGRPARRVDAYLREVAAAFARPEASAPAGRPLSPDEAKAFVREHFERFVNRKDIEVGRVNFAADFVDHGADVPPGTPPGPAGAMQYVGQAIARFPDLHVTIHDMIAEGDRVVVRNTWTATDQTTGRRLQFGGIVIWRLAGR
jgi:uncharacterized protein YbjT (DUF2867 family)/predicted ester cyclase